jgi:hypothetical protein
VPNREVKNKDIELVLPPIHSGLLAQLHTQHHRRALSGGPYAAAISAGFHLLCTSYIIARTRRLVPIVFCISPAHLNMPADSPSASQSNTESYGKDRERSGDTSRTGTVLRHPAVTSLISSEFTPLKVGVTSMVSSEHTHDSIKAFVQQDIKENTCKVQYDLWMEAVFGLRKVDIDRWKATFRSKGWFNNLDIQQQLRSYCDVSSETQRYDPFCKIANKVLELAKSDLFPADYTYPIDDIKFVRNDPVYLRRNNPKLDALRKPDVLGIRQRHESDLRPQDGKPPLGLDWAAVFFFCEFKVFRKKIFPLRLFPSLNSGKVRFITTYVPTLQ